MPRKHDTVIVEELEELNRLEENYRGKPESARVRMLRLIKQQPTLSINDIAVSVGYSVPTIKRWLKVYRSSGLDTLLQIAAGGKQSESDHGLDRLKQKLMEGDFRSLAEVRRWMDHHDGAQKGANSREPVAEDAKGDGGKNMQAIGAEASAAGGVLPENVLKFLTKLPTTYEVREWLIAFRNALQELLGDVDHIMLSLNVQCRIIEPEQYKPKVAIVDSVVEGHRSFAPVHNAQFTDETEPLARLLARLRGQNYPFKDYHPPKGFVFYYEGAYLGVMALWRERSKKPISEQTLATVERLRPFLNLLFSDIAARHQLSQPFDTAFKLVLHQIQNNGLTHQEGRVLTLQMLGCSYEEIAETLHISVNTVRSHIKAIYEKTGVHGQTHLFAKYFKPMTVGTTGQK